MHNRVFAKRHMDLLEAIQKLAGRAFFSIVAGTVFFFVFVLSGLADGHSDLTYYFLGAAAFTGGYALHVSYKIKRLQKRLDDLTIRPLLVKNHDAS